MRMAYVTFDCTDAVSLARFWADVMGWRVSPEADSSSAAVGGPDRPRDTPALLFFSVPEPKSAKNRMHLDLEAEDLAAETERLLALGATFVAEKVEGGAHWSTFADPEGNEFDVVQKE